MLIPPHYNTCADIKGGRGGGRIFGKGGGEGEEFLERGALERGAPPPPVLYESHKI